LTIEITHIRPIGTSQTIRVGVDDEGLVRSIGTFVEGSPLVPIIQRSISDDNRRVGQSIEDKIVTPDPGSTNGASLNASSRNTTNGRIDTTEESIFNRATRAEFTIAKLGGGLVKNLEIPSTIALDRDIMINMVPRTLDNVGILTRNGTSLLNAQPRSIISPLGELVEVAIPNGGVRTVGIVEPKGLSVKNEISVAVGRISRINVVTGIVNRLSIVHIQIIVIEAHKINTELERGKNLDQIAGRTSIGNEGVLNKEFLRIVTKTTIGKILSRPMTSGTREISRITYTLLSTWLACVDIRTIIAIVIETISTQTEISVLVTILQIRNVNGKLGWAVSVENKIKLMLHEAPLPEFGTEPVNRIVNSNFTTVIEDTIKINTEVRIATAFNATRSRSVGRIVSVAISVAPLDMLETDVTIMSSAANIIANEVGDKNRRNINVII